MLLAEPMGVIACTMSAERAGRGAVVVSGGDADKTEQ